MTVKVKSIREDENVRYILKVIKQNPPTQQTKEIESLIKIASDLESQLETVTSELKDVKSQLSTIQDKTLAAKAARVFDAVDVKVTEVKTQFEVVKSNITTTFAKAATAVKEKGISALSKTVDFLKIHSALNGLKDKLQGTIATLHKGTLRIDDIKAELGLAKNHVANAGRVLMGKETKEAKTSDHGILSGIQKAFGKISNSLAGMGLKVESAISKIEKLEQRSEKKSVRDNLSEIKKTRAGGEKPIEKLSPNIER